MVAPFFTAALNRLMLTPPHHTPAPLYTAPLDAVSGTLGGEISIRHATCDSSCSGNAQVRKARIRSHLELCNKAPRKLS
jgi:hypothetical protein